MMKDHETSIPGQDPYASSPQRQIFNISVLDQPERFNSLHWVFAPLVSAQPYYPEYLVTLTGAVRFDDDIDASPFTGWWRRDLFVEAPFPLRKFNQGVEGKTYGTFVLQQWSIFAAVGGIGTGILANSEWYVNGFGLDKDFLVQASEKTIGMSDTIKFWVTTRVSNRNLLYSVSYQMTLKGYLVDLGDELMGLNKG